MDIETLERIFTDLTNWIEPIDVWLSTLINLWLLTAGAILIYVKRLEHVTLSFSAILQIAAGFIITLTLGCAFVYGFAYMGWEMINWNSNIYKILGFMNLVVATVMVFATLAGLGAAIRDGANEAVIKEKAEDTLVLTKKQFESKWALTKDGWPVENPHPDDWPESDEMIQLRSGFERIFAAYERSEFRDTEFDIPAFLRKTRPAGEPAQDDAKPETQESESELQINDNGELSATDVEGRSERLPTLSIERTADRSAHPTS